MEKDRKQDRFKEGADRLQEISRRLNKLFAPDGGTPGGSSSGERGPGQVLSGGLAGILEQVGRLVEQAQAAGGTLHKEGAFGQGSGEGPRGVFGFSVKVGQGDPESQDVRVEPFGNLRKSEDGRSVEIREIREPIADVFDEADHLLVVLELPGILEEDLRIELEGDMLFVEAERGEKKYRKEILLPSTPPADGMKFSCNGGIAEIRLPKP